MGLMEELEPKSLLKPTHICIRLIIILETDILQIQQGKQKKEL
jgi:hypothetical protein